MNILIKKFIIQKFVTRSFPRRGRQFRAFNSLGLIHQSDAYLATQHKVYSNKGDCFSPPYGKEKFHLLIKFQEDETAIYFMNWKMR